MHQSSIFIIKSWKNTNKHIGLTKYANQYLENLGTYNIGSRSFKKIYCLKSPSLSRKKIENMNWTRENDHNDDLLTPKYNNLGGHQYPQLSTTSQHIIYNINIPHLLILTKISYCNVICFVVFYTEKFWKIHFKVTLMENGNVVLRPSKNVCLMNKRLYTRQNSTQLESNSKI